MTQSLSQQRAQSTDSGYRYDMTSWSDRKKAAFPTWSPLVHVWERMKVSGCSPSVRLVAMCIAFSLDTHTGSGWITIEQIGAETGLSRSEVVNCIKLLTKGRLTIKKRKNGEKAGTKKVRGRKESHTQSTGCSILHHEDEVWDYKATTMIPLFSLGKRTTKNGNIGNTYTLRDFPYAPGREKGE